MRFQTRLLLLLLATTMSACVYRQDIGQGNFYKAEDVAKLEAGMTREQVRFVMGTPMIQDLFHPDRWDYIFYVDSQVAARDRYQRVTVFFEDDRVARIESEGVTDDALPMGDGDSVMEDNDDGIFMPGTDN
jgi:outer membrane protein assembly factor BamE